MSFPGIFAALLVLAPAFGAGPGDDPAREPDAGRDTITEEELVAHVAALAAPELEGRDSPSLGLERAAAYVAERFAAAGLACAPDAERAAEAAADASAEPRGPEGCSYLRAFGLERPEPVVELCRLELVAPEAARFSYGTDFVPAHGCAGEAEGELVFVGYAIRDRGEGWDDLGTTAMKGKVAVLLEGEPEHARRFEGPELSQAASLWRKLADLADLEVEGVLVVRRASPPEGEPLAFRHTWAQFVGGMHGEPPREPPPALEITRAAAARLLGLDLDALEADLDGRSRGRKRGDPERRVRFASTMRETNVDIDNVVGWVPGSDPALAGEVVVIGAHYDHLGVDARGRIAYGADDNASGTAVLIEVAEAFARARPRRSICLVAFAAEEDGLLGSRAFVDRPPVPLSSIAAMINLDMVGRGSEREVAVIGIKQNRSFDKLLKRAQKLSRTGVTKLVTRGGEELFQRSDHYSFHQKNIPVLFLFEGLPISKNADYHTWRDVPELVQGAKMLSTARLTFNAAWILADDDERPPPPRD